MSNRSTNFIAVSLLIFLFFTAVFSMKDDSVTMDELAHLPAGYSYLTQKDMRLNPEHPPLLKDLAALPLLFIKNLPALGQGIKFPSELKAWKEDINGQWDFGFYFLYQMGNPVDKMIFWGRIPMILILVLLGFYIFKWARELFGNKAALLATFLFSFSPTFIAHGRLVTTDVGAAAGVFIATYYFLGALKSPTKKNIILAGISFGIAELCKFSAILLLPFFVFLGFTWWLIKLGKLGQVFKVLVLVFVIGFLLIWLVYQYHVWNYPPERQIRDTEANLATCSNLAKTSILWAADKPILKPISQYLTGLFMVFNRATSGQTTYFLGEISNLGWKNYFPIVYSIKEPMPFHILTLLALLYVAWRVKKPIWQETRLRLSGSRATAKGEEENLFSSPWLKNHFPEFAMLTFIGIYWLTSLITTLNIGARHLLPAFPFTIILVSAMTITWLKEPFLKLKCLILAFLISWQVVSVVSIYPHFLAYFNEVAGGPDKGYVYTVDSNLDWGQDLKRLKKWADVNRIDKVYLDYFGGSDPQYYLKNKSLRWAADFKQEDFPKGNYLAISATYLQKERGTPAPGFNQPNGRYLWLNKYEPVAKIGYSIFIYYIQ